MNTEALQYLVADAESWEATANAWENAYCELSERYKAYIRDSKARLETLQKKVDDERASWKAALKKRRSFGVGVFGGYGINGPTVGVGLVWVVM